MSRCRVLGAVAGSLAAGAGLLVALFYHRLGLTLSHYDARGHLVVARRIFDSITPGWQQVGAVWLPLPHLLNALPVQIDAFYRTGASGVAISVVSFAVATGAIAGIVFALSGSSLAAMGAAAVFALNPNLLYLQSTPMTEPLLLGLTTLAVALLVSWSGSRVAHGPDVRRANGPPGASTPNPGSTSGFPGPWRPSGVGWRPQSGRLATLAGVLFALACLTRYEAWPVTFSALSLAVWACWRTGDTWPVAVRRVAPIAAYPVLAILGFLLFSRVVIGEWFVSSGFFVPENPALGHPIEAVSQVLWGARTLSGYLLTASATVGLVWLAVRAVVSKQHAVAAIALSLGTVAALPWWAFLHGHPYRIRYMVPLMAAEAVGAGIVMGELTRRSRRLGSVAIAAIVIAVAFERPPVDAQAAMVVEAQWDRPNTVARRQVTDCLRAGYRSETIMASMGSLGHYMQETSEAGFSLRDFLHEGNGDIWLRALERPAPFVGWILIEEKAEGGDMLSKIARENPKFLDGFSRVCEASGIALYQRQNRMLTVAR